MTTISVVVPSRNDATYLKSCLEALARQTRQADEIVVVDNDSSDSTSAVARRFGARVVSQPVHGIWPAASAGYDAASSDIIARLDADSVPGDDWVEKAVACLAGDDGPDLLVGDGDFYGPRPLINWIGDHCYVGAMWVVLPPFFGHEPVFGSNFAMTRDAWKELRGRAHIHNAGIHDDLDLTFALPPWMTVRNDPEWRVGISNRPFDTWRGIGRRLHWVVTTVRANYPDSIPFRHKRLRRRWRRAHGLDPRG